MARAGHLFGERENPLSNFGLPPRRDSLEFIVLCFICGNKTFCEILFVPSEARPRQPLSPFSSPIFSQDFIFL